MPRLVRIGTTIALLAVAILGASAQRAYAQQGWATSPSSLSPVNISGGGADVAFDAAGNGFAVWVQADGTIRSIWLARYEPEIGTWRLPGTQLSSAGQDTMAPRVGVDGAGNAIVAWVRQAGGTYYLESRRYATVTDTWSAPAAIATVGAGGAGPDLAVTPEVLHLLPASLRASLGKNALDYADRTFDIEAIGARFAALLAGVKTS